MTSAAEEVKVISHTIPGATDYAFDGNASQVKGHLANVFGLYEMSGNYWEWFHDRNGGYLPYDGQTDPTGPTSGDKLRAKGGWWNNNSESLALNTNIGLRVAIGGRGYLDYPPEQALTAHNYTVQRYFPWVY